MYLEHQKKDTEFWSQRMTIYDLVTNLCQFSNNSVTNFTNSSRKLGLFLSLDLICIKIVKREKIKYFEIIMFRKSGVWIAV